MAILERKERAENLTDTISNTHYGGSKNSCRMWNIAYIWVSSMITSDTRYTREFKSRIAMAKNSIQQSDALHQQIEIHYMEETSKVLLLELGFVRY
jgi:hypothetical protein